MNYPLWLAGALALGVAGFFVRRRAAGIGQGLIILSCLSLVGVLLWQVRRTLFTETVPAPNRPLAVVSFFLANQVQEAIAGQPGTIVLVLPPAGALDTAQVEAYVNALRAPLLRGHPEWQLEIAHLNAPPKAARAGQIPLAAYQQLVAQHATALAFVGLAPVPAGWEALFATGTKVTTPWFLYDPQGSTHWLAALKQNQVRSVIVPRPDADPGAAANVAGMPGEIFDRFYFLVTPANVDQLAARLAR
ncbi:MAG TPA: hypothetical protein PKN95_05810 [Verrucomicrobiota bacterium]|nr:hypothetical protein [Verrucomicrobiota bacterium]HNT15413.1 hypothetical protein [Verrucomicrobiota bacterium]